MYNSLKRNLAYVLMICMMFSMLTSVPVTAAEKTKDTGIITRGQVCKLVNEMLGATKYSKNMKNIVNYVKGDDYYTTMSIAYNAGYIIPNKKNELGEADVKATYYYVATIFSRILNESRSKLLGKYNASDMISSKAFKSYLAKEFPNIISKNVTDKTLKHNIVINTPNVTLTNVVIDGNLIIGDGVADQEAILDNVTVKGNLIVRGGGENSIKIFGTTSISTLIIQQVNNKVSIKVSDDANVQMIYINDGCNDVTLYGPIGTVNVTGDGINVGTNNATITNVVLSGENTSFLVSKDTVVNKVEISQEASNANLNVTGNVSNVSSNASNSIISVEGNGNVNSITASEAAKGTEIKVSENAVVNTITSDAQETIVSGDGKVSKATINGSNSAISTPNTEVFVGEKTTGVQNNSENKVTPTPTVKPSPTPTTSVTPSPTITSTPKSSTGGSSIPTTAPTAPTTVPTAPTTVPTTTVAPTSIVTPTIPPIGSTENPASEDGIIYQTDNRFEAGYPQIIIGTKTDSATNLTVKLKLKDGIASEQSPVSVYYIVTTVNTSWDASSNSVIHGHLGTDHDAGNGTNIHDMIYCSTTGAIKITDTTETVIPLTISSYGEQGMAAYFVIKTAEKTSDVPTKIEFTGETVSSFVDPFAYPSAPKVSETYWTAPVSNSDNSVQQRTVRVFVSKALNTASVVTGSAFTVNNVSGASISVVSVHKGSTTYFSVFQDWIDLTLTYPTGSNLSNISITYTPPEEGGFTDMANTPNPMTQFKLYGTAPSGYYSCYELKDAVPVLKSIIISSDGKYISLTVSPRLVFQEALKIKVNGQDWTMKSSGYSVDYCRFNIANNNGTTIDTSYNIEITSVDGSKIKDVLGQEYSSISGIVTTIIDSTITAESASLNLAKKELKLTLAGDSGYLYDLNYSCQYVLNVDGVSYRLRGISSSVYSPDGKMTLVFNAQNLFDIDFTKITSGSQATISLSPLSTSDTYGYMKETSGKPLTSLGTTVINIQ